MKPKKHIVLYLSSLLALTDHPIYSIFLSHEYFTCKKQKGGIFRPQILFPDKFKGDMLGCKIRSAKNIEWGLLCNS